MIKLMDHCCGCATGERGCRGNACSNMNVPVLCCDICEEPFEDMLNDDVYDVDGEEICEECLKEKFKKR